jgi:hypothetical protein
VISVFGAPRRVVLEQGGGGGGGTASASVKVSLANNSAVAIMRDVTSQGWRYEIDNLAGGGVGGDVGARPDHETITVFVSGRCTAVRTVDAPSTVAAQQHHPLVMTRPLVPQRPPHRRVSFGSEGGGETSRSRDDPRAIVTDLSPSNYPLVEERNGARSGRGSEGPKDGHDDCYGGSHARRRNYPHHRPSDHPSYDEESWYDADRHGIGEDDDAPLGHYNRRYEDRAASSPRSPEPPRSSSVSCRNGSNRSRSRHHGAHDGDDGSGHCGVNVRRSRSRSRSPSARPVSCYPPGYR